MNYKTNKLALAIIASALPVMSFANTLTLEEVVVTAQKREASLQEVPAAITALSADHLEKAGITDYQSLQVSTPSLVITDNMGFVSPFIRGVGSSNIGLGGSTSVATYVDGFYNPRFNSNMMELGNLQQVEVLKGPQGALYGRNATGGAIVLSTKSPQPGESLTGNVKFTGGDYDNRKFSAFVAGGLTENLAASFGVMKQTRDGFVEILTPGRDALDDRDFKSLSAKLVYVPTDNSEFVLAYSYNDADDTAGFGNQQVDPTLNENGLSPAGQSIANALTGLGLGVLSQGSAAICNSPASCQATGVALAAGATSTVGQPGTTYSTFDANVKNTDSRVSLKATLELDTVELVSLSSWTESELDGVDTGLLGVDYVFPLTGTKADIGFTDAYYLSTSVSQEFQLKSTDSDIQWILGLNYFQENGDDTSLTPVLLGIELDETLVDTLTAINSSVGLGLSASGVENIATAFQSNIDVDYETVAVAAFGQARIPVTDVVSVTLGARQSYEEYALDNKRASAGDSEKREYFDQVTGTIIVDATFDDFMVYASLSSGFKSGALNALNPDAGITEPEEITSLELGFKSTLLDGRINLNGAVFDYEYENAHIARIGGSTGGSTFFLNAQEASVQGLELDLVGLVSENLKMNVGITALFDKEYEELVIDDPCCTFGGPAIDLSGNDIAGAADLSIVLGGTYSKDMDIGSFDFNTNVSYSSGYYHDAENLVGTGGANDDGYTTINSSITFTSSDETWDLSLWVNNWTDEEYYRSGTVNNQINPVATAGQPRHYGITAGYNF